MTSAMTAHSDKIAMANRNQRKPFGTISRFAISLGANINAKSDPI
jgi:hypothetical protein